MGFKNIKACLMEASLERVVYGAIPEFITTFSISGLREEDSSRRTIGFGTGQMLRDSILTS